MRLLLVTLLVLLVSTAPLLAYPTIGLYFTEDGVTYERCTSFGGYIMEAHVILYFEVDTVVQGAVFMMDPGSAWIQVTNESYPPGVQVGSITTGLGLEFNPPLMAEAGMPLIIGTLDLINLQAPLPPAATFQFLPALGRVDPVYVDAAGLDQPLTPLTSEWAAGASASDATTWSGVKALYR